MELVSEAIAFAVQAHDGMRRKKSQVPYILHPLEAAVIAGSMSDDQNLIAAAVLHDVVEDADVTMAEIEQRFGKRVRQLVECETENKRENLPPEETWKIRKEESLRTLQNAKDPAILMIWLSDKLSNLRAIYRDWKKEGEAVWQKFHQSDPALQEWYFTTIAELTKPLAHAAVWAEYKALTDIVFKKG